MNKRLMIPLVLMIALTLSVAALMIGCSPDTGNGESQTGQTTTAETLGVAYPTLMTYEDYKKLSPELQQAYYETFPNPELYMQWFNAAVQAYSGEESGEPVQEGAEGQITSPTQNPGNTGEIVEIPLTKPETDVTAAHTQPAQGAQQPTPGGVGEIFESGPNNPETQPQEETAAKQPQTPIQQETEPVFLTGEGFVSAGRE